MKKIIFYILILIVFIELFGSLTIVSASTSNPNEPCMYNPPSTTPNNSPCKSAFLPGTNTPISTNNQNQSYHLLAPLPNLGDSNGDINTSNGLGAYLNPMIKIFIGLCAVLSVVMIVVGGLEYMTSELAHTKESGKERIMQAILGLIIALGAWALLNTINPDLLKSEFNPGAVDATSKNTVTTGGNAQEGCSEQELTTKEACEKEGFKWTKPIEEQPVNLGSEDFEP